MGKRKILTLADKQSIIKRIDEGASQAAIAREYGIGQSTVSEIYKKQRNKIEEFLGTQIDSPAGSTRKKMRKANSEALETAVFAWFEAERSKGAVVSGPILAEKALAFDRRINGGDSTFRASTGWLKRFKWRHGIRELPASGECLSAPGGEESAAEFRRSSRHRLGEQGLLPELQRCNAHETGGLYCCWRLLPNKTLAPSGEGRAPGHKQPAATGPPLPSPGSPADHIVIDDDDDDDDDDEPKPPPLAREALHGADIILRFLEAQENVSPTDLVSVLHLKNVIRSKRDEKMRQKSIDLFKAV